MINEFIGKVSDLSSPYDSKISPEAFAELINLLEEKKITGKIAKDILPKMIVNGQRPTQIIESEGIKRVDDSDIEAIIEKVINDNSSEVERYKNGEQKLFGFFVGQVMRESSGQADPAITNKILKERLDR